MKSDSSFIDFHRTFVLSFPLPIDEREADGVMLDGAEDTETPSNWALIAGDARLEHWKVTVVVHKVGPEDMIM